MAEPIFRKESLDRLQSPEEVDQALRVLSRRDWVPLGIIGGLLVLVGAWSVFGRIAITAEGRAILVTPKSVLPFESSTSGQIAKWRVKAGDIVTAGQVLAVFKQGDLESDLAQAVSRSKELDKRNTEMARLEARQSELQRSDIKRRRAVIARRMEILTKQLDDSRRLTEEIRAKAIGYVTSQRESLNLTRTTIVDLGKQLEERVQAYERLRAEGLCSVETLLAARRSSIDSKLQIAQIDLQVNEVELSAIRTEKGYVESLATLADQENEITSLSLQLEGLDTEAAHLDQQDQEAQFARSREENELKRTISQLEEKLASSRELKANCAGQILELTASEGAVVAAGMKLGTIDTRKDTDEMVVLAYFQAKDGKRITPGMKAQVSPETVQSERFGRMLATVASVSGYPVTAQGAENYVGNADVARSLTEFGGQIEVIATAKLDPTSYSGFAWTSAKGPPQKISAGTMSSISVVVEERAPITYVIPALLEWSGF